MLRQWELSDARLKRGLRAWKENSAGVRTYFLYDGTNLIGEVDSSGAMQAVQTWGAEADALDKDQANCSLRHRVNIQWRFVLRNIRP